MLENLYIKWLSKYGLNIDDEALQRYGFNILVRYIFIFIILLTTSLCFNSTIPTFVFFMFFSILRTRTGGIHLGNDFSCFIFTLMVLILFPIIGKNLELSFNIKILIGIFNILVVGLLAPIDCKQKRLSVFEKEINKKYSLCISCLYLVFIIVLDANINIYIVLSIILNIFSLIISKILLQNINYSTL